MRQSPPGHKADTGKNRLELLPYDALAEVGKVLTLGASKYGDRNWEKGIDYGRVYAALQRHVTAWWQGQDVDPETGLSHMAHCAANALFLLAYERRGRRSLDDRPRSELMKQDVKALKRELKRIAYARERFRGWDAAWCPKATQDAGRSGLARLDAREKEIRKLLSENQTEARKC